MANVVCIGRGSTISQYASRLKSQGHRLHLVGSVDEYLRATSRLGAAVVLVAESFDAGARESVAYWVRHASPGTPVVYLYEHFAGHLTQSGLIADVAKLESVMQVLASLTWFSSSLF
jgi:hypothetical protein